MEVGKELLDRFPIEKVFLIATFGLFVIISLPFDVFKLFENGVPRTYTDTPWVEIGNGIKDNFAAFTNVQHLGINPPYYGFLETLLLSLAFGVIVIFLFDTFNWLNHIPKRTFQLITQKRPPKPEENYKEQLAFADWIKKRGLRKYLDFSYSMTSVATGLIWGDETFLLIVSASFLWAVWTSNGIHWEWFWPTIVPSVAALLFYEADKRGFRKLDREWQEAFDESRWEESRLEEELMRFKRLLDAGGIAAEEFEKEKEKILKELELARKKGSSRKGKPSSAAKTRQS